MKLSGDKKIVAQIYINGPKVEQILIATKSFLPMQGKQFAFPSSSD